MKNISHRSIRLIREDLTAYDTTINCELPMPKFILDSKGKLFAKNRTIFEPGKSNLISYSETPVTVLSNVEVISVDAEYSAI